jgi:peptide/nickel transport system substrate-binding protein
MKISGLVRSFLAVLALAHFGIGAAQSGSGSVVLGVGEIPTSLDPPTDWNIPSTWVHMNVFDCLVWRERDTAQFVPWLASDVTSVDALTWRLTLREGIRFHNGEPFDASAVAWTFERILADPTMITHPQWTWIAEVRELSPFLIEIVTTQPEPAFMSKISGTGCGIQAPAHGRAQQASGAAYVPVGTGPFSFVEWERENYVRLRGNADYFRGAPEVSELTFRAIPEASTRVANLLTGAVDLIVAVPAQDWDRIRSNAGTSTVEYLTTRTMRVPLRISPTANTQGWSGPTADLRIRQALNLAIDRELLIEVIDGMGIPVLSRVTPPTLGWDEAFFNNPGTYDPDRARALLAEAGYNGEQLRFTTSTANYKQREVAEVLVAMWEAVGLNIRADILDPTTYREQIYFPAANEEIDMDAWGNSFFDPWIVFDADREGRREYNGWTGPLANEANALIAAAAQEMDPDTRRAMYVRLQELHAADLPYLYLYLMKGMLGINDRLVWNMPTDEFLWLGDAKLAN